MSAALDNYGAPQYSGGAIPHRKPMPPVSSYPLAMTGSDQIYTRQPSHSHTRTASSSIIGPGQYPSHTQTQMQPSYDQPARRTLSNATSSTTSSINPPPLNRGPTNTTYASSIRRSTSSRSQQQQATSYVALLRRQKATVWCDHAQSEDLRVLAQQRQAKARANMAIAGGVTGARTSASSSGGVRGKIRHHGAPKASAFNAGNMSGAGVPMRLSASEVDDADSDDDKLKGTRYHHQRNSSGRSSLSSGQRASLAHITTNNSSANASMPGSLLTTGRLSESSTPPSRASYSPSINDHRQLTDDTPVARDHGGQDYFGRPQLSSSNISGGSGSSEERSYGEHTRLPDRTKPEVPPKSSDELRRRGSVDERTMTVSSVRLFVANPDLSD